MIAAPVTADTIAENDTLLEEVEITYAYLVDHEPVPATWIGLRSVALAAGSAYLGADEGIDGAWTYHADETNSRWRVSAEDLAVYGAAVLDDRASEAYSLWCAGSCAQEVRS